MFNDYSYLYIEDDPMSREIMHTIMTKIMRVERLLILEDSQDFLAHARAIGSPPDIFLLDIHVHPSNGFEILQTLRADSQFCDARIIALTASVMNEEVEELQRAGFDGTISKPISAQGFPELMQRVLEGESIWHIA